MNLEEQDACLCCTLTVDEMLARAFRIDVSKALNPLDDDDFVVIIGRLTRSLINATKGEEGRVLDKAIGMLDVNWANMTGTERDRIIEAARIAVGKAPTRFIKPIKNELTVVGPRVTKSTKLNTKRRLSTRLSTNIKTSFEARDKRVIDHLVNSQAFFIRDEWGRRSSQFSGLARQIVADGLEEGLGRDSIAESLDRRIRASIGLEKSKGYWNVIAGVFTNRSRTWGQLASYDEAGIERMVFSAVMDEVTTDQCRALNGRVFEVSAGIQRYTAVQEAEDPEAVKDIMPWIQTGSDGQGGKVMFVKGKDGRRTIVGQVFRSGVGKKDDPGAFRGMFTSAQLQAIGAFLPPLHGRCRSTVEPEL